MLPGQISKPSGNKHTERNKLAVNGLLGGPKTSSDRETRFLAMQQTIQLERRPNAQPAPASKP
jgi:hypothetical protein